MNTKKRLETLLNQYNFYTADNGEPYTPKESFIADYEAMIADFEGYIKQIADDLFIDGSGDSLINDMREIFAENGGGANGAYAVIQNSLELLELYTVEKKIKQRKLTR